ncbi:hypothetical protein NQ318_009000, partial [Aromia moschata]
MAEASNGVYKHDSEPQKEVFELELSPVKIKVIYRNMNKNKTKKIFRKYYEDVLRKVLQEIKEGSKLRETCRKYGVPRSTVLDRIKGRIPEPLQRMGPYSVLTTKVEKKKLNLKKENKDYNDNCNSRVKHYCGICTEELVSDTEEKNDKNVGCDKCTKWFHLGCTQFIGLKYSELIANLYSSALLEKQYFTPFFLTSFNSKLLKSFIFSIEDTIRNFMSFV